MNKKLMELLDQINAKKEEVRNLAESDKLEEAKAAKKELQDLQNKFDILKDLEDGEQVQAAAGNGLKTAFSVVDIGASFVNIIKAGLKKTPVAEEDTQVLNMMQEGTDADGGLTVPQDISTQIRTLRRTEDALEGLVNVESVSTITGSRVYEVNADATPFDNVDEAADFPDVETPKLRKINYAIKKKGGILKVTRELLMDSSENILGFLKKWIAKKAKATRNALIIKQIDTITAGKAVAVATIDDLKNIFNVQLDPAVVVSASAVTNQDGFNVLDKLKDSDGKYIMQPNPVMATQQLLFGRYPVKIVSNKVLKTVTGKAPIICGDLKEAITIFDKENLSIELSTEAGDLWNKDMTGIKVRERLDIQTIDEEAIIRGEITIPTGE